VLVYLSLKVSGVPVEGYSPEASLGRENPIECLYYRDAVARAPIPGDAMTLAQDLTYDPLVIRKRIDWSSAVLERVLTQNEVVEGTFGFLRVDANGEEERYFTTKIEEARIAAITRFVPEMRPGSVTHDEPLEEVAFVFKRFVTTLGDIKPPGPRPDTWVTGDGGSSPPVAAPEPPGRLVAERRPPSRVAVVAPLTEARAADLERWRTA
jgi:type VI secretion system secreted protein Hcp